MDTCSLFHLSSAFATYSALEMMISMATMIVSLGVESAAKVMFTIKQQRPFFFSLALGN